MDKAYGMAPTQRIDVEECERLLTFEELKAGNIAWSCPSACYLPRMTVNPKHFIGDDNEPLMILQKMHDAILVDIGDRI